MKSWELVLVHDKKGDLCDTTRGDWFLTHSLAVVLLNWPKRYPLGTGPRQTNPDLARERLAPLDGTNAREWCAGVQALRSVARRLHGLKTRKAGIDDRSADRTMARYVGRLTPVVVKTLTDFDNPVQPAARKTFQGVRLCPTFFTARKRPCVWVKPLIEGGLIPAMSVSDTAYDFDLDALAPTLEGMTSFTIDYVLQIVFGSLVDDTFAPVCAKCGCELGLTEKGRVPRAGMCKPCQNREWHERQPKEKLRAQWRARKAAERQRQTEGE